MKRMGLLTSLSIFAALQNSVSAYAGVYVCEVCVLGRTTESEREKEKYIQRSR